MMNKTKRWLRGLPWLAGAGFVFLILPIQLSADASDFAKANIFTAILLLAAWLAFSIGLALTSLPRLVPRIFFFGPIVALMIFLAAFKFERVDGELNPIFRLRWGGEQQLAADATPSAGNGESVDGAKLPPQFFEARPTDFPQFLGPNRNAMLNSAALDPNWNSTPPKIAWKKSIGDGWSGFAIQGDIAVTMEQRELEEWISAYSVLDGGLIWRYVIDSKHSNIMGGIGPRSTPTIVDNQVIACSAVSEVVCMDLQSGEKIWSCDLLELAGTTQAEFEKEVLWGRSGSALAVADKVFVPLGGAGANVQTLLALDRKSGKEVWRGGTDQISYSSPLLATLAGVPQIVLTSQMQVAAYDLESGQQLWSVPWPSSSSNDASVSQPVVLDDSQVLISKGYGGGCRLLEIVRDGEAWKVNEPIWISKSSLRTKFTSCVVKDGFAYGLSDGILECVRLSDGKKQWKNGRYRQGQVLLVDDYLLVTSERGELVLLSANPRDFEEIGKVQVIGDVTWNTAALSGNRFLMRNSDEAACVLLPLK